MKKLLLLLLLGNLGFAQSLEPTIGAKFTGGLSYDMEHEYYSGQVGLLYTPKYGTAVFDNIGISGEYIYDYQQEFTGKHNFHVLRMQFAKPVNDFVSLTYFGGYVGGFNDNTLKSFKGDLKTNLVWGCGIRLSDPYMMAEALYENIAGYPHISVGVHFYLWDILGNKEY